MALVAEPSDAPRPSFYGQGDDRLPLNPRFRTRYLNGGAFDGGTELILWAQRGFLDGDEPFPCDEGCDASAAFFFRERDESGVVGGIQWFNAEQLPVKLAVGSEQLPVAAAFCTLDVWVRELCNICSPPDAPNQGWVLPIYSAAGRFSVGLDAARLDEDFCG